jgi:rhodanese-related sulfurtransferase
MEIVFVNNNKCDCGVCKKCCNLPSDSEISIDSSGIMIFDVLSTFNYFINDLISSIGDENKEEIVLLNKLRESSNLIKVAAKHKPNNPALWARCLSDARKRFHVCPSAYCNAFAAKTYKRKGGTWRTLKSK